MGTRRHERGAALLVAISAIAILTAVAVDLAYNTRVSLQTAVNARDELRATYLAKSSLALSRLVLNFQQRLDAATGNTGTGTVPPAGKGTSTTATTTTSTTSANQGGPLAGLGLGGLHISLRLWELVPVDSAMASLFLGRDAGAGARPSLVPPSAPASAPDGGATAGAGTPEQEGARRAFGDAQGSFHATIEDEERKINLRQFAGLAYQQFGQALRLAQLVKDPRWDFLFDEDDANGLRVGRKETFGAIKDWVDEDEMGDVFTGDPTKPFENGYGDENALYDRLPDRYKAKNAPFDSLDEVYMVAGITDAFMAAFGDKLTVYPDASATINVNTDDPQQLLVNALLMSDPPGVPQPAILDPAFLGKLQATLALLRPLPFLSITPQQFAGALTALGVKIDVAYTQPSNPKNLFSDRSATFHVRAVGVAGEVKKTIDAVVTFDRRAEGLAQDQGRLLHWREE
jgi:general secretion pathway protein K